jgi:nucleoside-diphosphate-sugar epimerase
MKDTVFLAGASGAIGIALVRLLVDDGYRVYGTTRRPEPAAALAARGAEPVIVDIFDRQALFDALARTRPGIVVHQLTDLPPGLDPARMADAVPRNARIRDEGTRNLVEAARSAGCRRFVAQSIAWGYAPGPKPYTEAAPLDATAIGARAITLHGVVALERAILDTSGDQVGTVLRYGNLYGPGTGRNQREGASPVHVEAAAWAALLAVRHPQQGIFNVAEDGAEVSSERAKQVLGWRPDMRLAEQVQEAPRQ